MKNRASWSVVALITSIGLSFAPAADAASGPDACAVLVPRGVVQRLQKKYPTHRIPLAADSHSSCVRNRVRAGAGGCPLVTSGDFDGDGYDDLAVLLPAKQGKYPPKLVVAMRLRKAWTIEEVPMGTDPQIRRLVLETLPPQLYQDSPAVTSNPRSIRTDHDGLAMSACESWSNGYFRVDGKWKRLSLSE
jgi:hypothetical protein